MLALRHLCLDEVWWLVSPQNPLKSEAGMAPLDERLKSARKMAAHPAIRVTDIETIMGTRYTADTLKLLRDCFPEMRMVWLMGADNLAQISRWENWTRIFRTLPIAVFDRAPYSFDALASKAALAFGRNMVTGRDAPLLADMEPPAWMFFHTQLHPASATTIRAERASHAFD